MPDAIFLLALAAFVLFFAVNYQLEREEGTGPLTVLIDLFSRDRR